MASRAKRKAQPYRPPARVARALRQFGGPTELAKTVGITRGAIRFWTRVPAEYVLRLERASGGKLTRYEMRPDLYGQAPS
jgi:DNA-binding transcriptional regulator YdaS (Cro superfamily)